MLKQKLRLNSSFTAHQKVVDRLNSVAGTTWTAGLAKIFQTKTISQINKMAGRMKMQKQEPEQKSEAKQEETIEIDPDLPVQWDWSKQIEYILNCVLIGLWELLFVYRV